LCVGAESVAIVKVFGHQIAEAAARSRADKPMWSSNVESG
jgi:hypothetical protein